MKTKIIYAMTGLELGEIHTEQKEQKYTFWSKFSDEYLAILGLKRVQEKEVK
jgi:hypothetical protein